MSKILVSGSIANDYLMQFDGNFSEHILPDQIEHLSLSFTFSHMEKFPGGTSQNVAYSLWLLDHKEDTILYGTVGKDFVPDPELQKYIDYQNLLTIPELYTASAYIFSDAKDRQITGFYAWAMLEAGKQTLKQVDQDLNYLIVMANEWNTMIKHLQEAHKLWIESFFMPGQAMPILTSEQLLDAANSANHLICNEYEFDLYKDKTWLSEQEIIALYDKVVVTLGEKWVKVISIEYTLTIPWAKVENVANVTWAWDSFVAALVAALYRGQERNSALKFANIFASFVVEKVGTMKHTTSLEQLQKRYHTTYQEELKR